MLKELFEFLGMQNHVLKMKIKECPMKSKKIKLNNSNYAEIL